MCNENELTDYPVYENVKKLRTLDIFAGCGGKKTKRGTICK